MKSKNLKRNLIITGVIAAIILTGTIGGLIISTNKNVKTPVVSEEVQNIEKANEVNKEVDVNPTTTEQPAEKLRLR